MMQSECIQVSLPNDIALKIASLLQVPDVCALGSCSRFWSELCGSDSIWESLAKERWPSLTIFHDSSSSTAIKAPISKGWRGFYIKRHKGVMGKATAVAKFVELCSSSTESLKAGEHLKAIEDMSTAQLGFKDVQMFLFKPKCNVLLNVVGLLYCIHRLGVPGEYVMEALQSCQISERQLCVKWLKLFRFPSWSCEIRGESQSRLVSLADLAMGNEPDVLLALQEGGIHGFF